MSKLSQSRRTLFTQCTIVALALLFWAIAPQKCNGKELIFKKGDRVAIVGDSITEQKKYTKYIEMYLTVCVPELELTTYQFGWGGEKAPGFVRRMENDLIPWNPTVVLSCYGMNDGGYRLYNDSIGKKYEDAIRIIQARCKKLGARMIVAGPGAVDNLACFQGKLDADNADIYYNKNLSMLSKIAKRVAKSNGFRFANLHQIMMEVVQKAKASLGKEYHVCDASGIHPLYSGHLVMAYAFLKAMGLDGKIGTITIDMKGKITATKGHKVLSSDSGKAKIESSRYPFCFYGKEKEPNATRSILPFLPFNKELNRYMLVVKNLNTPKAEVKWGKTSKVFSKADLEAGINLAEEFHDNPFSKPFKALEIQVLNKQKRETRTIKGAITLFPSLIEKLPNDKEVMDAIAVLRSELLKRNAQDALNLKKAVKPVIHTIQITPKANN